MTNPKTPEHETIIPDAAAYRKYPVREGDDEHALILKYRQAQIDCLCRLTGKTAAQLPGILHDPQTQRLIREHNKKMKLTDMTA